VPDRPDLYRLTDPARDGLRRGRQAVHDLRAQGFTVQADYTLDPTPEHSLSERLVSARQTRLARAATVRSPQLGTTAHTAPACTTVPVTPGASGPSTTRTR
jgi:hypothetical protein